MSKKNTDTDDFVKIVHTYLNDNITDRNQYLFKELEVRFGTRGVKPITKMDFNNVMQKIISEGFETPSGSSEGTYMLRIQNEYLDARTGRTKQSNVRTEINGLELIHQYCKTNILSPDWLVSNNQEVKFVQKSYATVEDETNINDQKSKIIYPVDRDNYNFRVSYSYEKTMYKRSIMIKDTVLKWSDQKKTFRLLNRIVFEHKNIPLRIEMSVVKSSQTERGRMVSEYNMQAADIFNNSERYEIEIEVNERELEYFIEDAMESHPEGSVKNPLYLAEQLVKQFRKTIKYILCGLQQTNYPISYSEQTDILSQYMNIIGKNKTNSNSNRSKFNRPGYSREVYPNNYIGPSSYTLQIKHISPINDNMVIPNIHTGYSVTDKADGDRKLLFISNSGKIYLINTNMNVQFTGTITENVEIFNSLLDGEHILYDKNRDYINLYAAFDLYYLNNRDIRALPFIAKNIETTHSKYRLTLLVMLVKSLNIQSIIPGKNASLTIKEKDFYLDTDSQTIFDGCRRILTDVEYSYNTDGLIFTPIDLGVGSNIVGKSGPNMKIAWEHSFKWKPAEFNTIDFLITTKKNKNGQDEVSNIFESGINTQISTQLTQYKTLVLRVGFDERKHGYLNPFIDVINNKLPHVNDIDITDGYKPVPFHPTNPYDYEANIANIIIKKDDISADQMFTEENEVFEDNMIIEFRYDSTKPPRWRWVPLRVRYDKTAEYRRGLKNFGNAYHVANSNWHSIHNPITEEMIISGNNIPNELGDDDIYYNKVIGKSNTRAMRDFHNLVVKRMLIMGVSQYGDTLIDYAVGKGGDFPKWIASKLSFVFGIDISKDNIENNLNGAYARYLNNLKQWRSMPSALFANGNSAYNIKDGSAMLSDRYKQISAAIFGQGSKDATQLGKGIYNQFGKGVNGFNVSSCQFAIHYFFENVTILQNFLRNVSECTAEGGYFIGTSYDGGEIFKILKNIQEGESMEIKTENDNDIEGNTIWKITKQYSQTSFDNDITSLGYAIDVYQDSINKTFREYLVNYNYLNRIMENYGFVLIGKKDAEMLKLPHATGMFSELYNLMENEIRRDPRKRKDIGNSLNMTATEKQISFYNRYFIYKKVRNVDAQAVMLDLSNKTLEQVLQENEESKEAQLYSKDTTPKQGEDVQLDTTPKQGEDVQLDTTPKQGEDVQLDTTPKQGEDVQLDTTPKQGEDVQLDTTSKQGEDVQLDLPKKVHKIKTKKLKKTKK